MTHPVLIVGGGLAGLTAAHLLHQAGTEFMLVEARDRLGGRILSADATGAASTDGFDLGPSWFWPMMQPELGEFMRGLGLESFAQQSEGDTVVQRSHGEEPRRYRGYRQEPSSMRLAGGTGAVITALASGLPAGAVRLNTKLTRLALAGGVVEANVVDASGSESKLIASHVILALPPRLLEASVAFQPALEATTAAHWRDTPTWMAPHAKFFALYDKPFWQEAGLSGQAQSMVGPLVEIHDATTASGQAALFGFVGVPAAQRQAAGREALIGAAVRQLAQLFGPEAAQPKATLLKDWAADPLTSTAADQSGGAHPHPSHRPWVSGEWSGRISLSGSETSRSEPGYLAGAVEAARHTVKQLLRQRAA
jgi:monoamine oxidase